MIADGLIRLKFCEQATSNSGTGKRLEAQGTHAGSRRNKTPKQGGWHGAAFRYSSKVNMHCFRDYTCKVQVPYCCTTVHGANTSASMGTSSFHD